MKMTNDCSATFDCTAHEQQLYKRLLLMSLGDRSLVERLIRYEQQRAPEKARADLIDSAIERWVGDNNRWR